MSNKVRMRVTVTFEYDADPADYEGRKPADMADLDRLNYEEDFPSLLDQMSVYPLYLKVEAINGND